jgi:serine O-acetyltransferase
MDEVKNFACSFAPEPERFKIRSKSSEDAGERFDMFKQKSKLKEDILRFYKMQEHENVRNRLFTIWRSPGIYAVITYRFGNWLYHKPRWLYFILFPINLYLQHRMKVKWGIMISEAAEIEGGFVVMHQGGIFIPWNFVAGRNLTVHHDVTFGYTYGIRKGFPVLGDDVTVAPGAKILGKIRIGNNVKIGPNVVLMKDVPDNSIVQAGEARILNLSPIGSPSDFNRRQSETGEKKELHVAKSAS